MTTNSPLHTAARRLGESSALDEPVDFASRVWTRVFKSSRVRSLLGGDWLGHPLHPMLTDIPIGSWTSANVLDIVGGMRGRVAARRLMGLGVLSAIPTAAAGWTDWLKSPRHVKRVGLVHAVANTIALIAYTRSYMARRDGQHGRGVWLGLVGTCIASVAGYLGGHMAFGAEAQSAGSASARARDNWVLPSEESEHRAAS